MINSKYKMMTVIILFLVSIFCSCSKNDKFVDIAVSFSGEAIIEVGGPFTGVEFHHSYPAPQRFSFFYPVANSIDMSTDYWFRDTTLSMEIGLKIGDKERVDISRISSEIDLTPYNVKFNQENIQVSYQFCNSKPAMVITYTLKNNSRESEVFELDTRLSSILKTCHTYRAIKADKIEYLSDSQTTVAHYSDEEIKQIVLFVSSTVEQPVAHQTDDGTIINIYQKELKPQEACQIVQIIGSCYDNELLETVGELDRNYANEIKSYEDKIINKAVDDYVFQSSDKTLVQSLYWAKAMLASLDHYIDGRFIPMPCPAEYNFYFTHDVLVTDLAAVNFDLPRVKRDLNFIIDHANDDFIIPHAYYWKDGEFKTEFADQNNWNHFWFIQVAASYLRHSDDKELLNKLYPYLEKSLQNAMHGKEEDGLIYAYFLDGWDIGNNFGPRSFMTIMAIKGIRDFIYISADLDRNLEILLKYELIADQMESALEEKLWCNETGFLMNFYENGEIDPHYYAGSLLAAHFGLLDEKKRFQLICTAGEKLVDPKIGTYTVYPPDFHLLGDLLKFNGNEVGAPYHYANGGVWNHCNGWYSLGLMATGQRQKAATFIRNIMTLDGIINSPNGQPAMYEYRCSDMNSPAIYGKVDKPNFLWAAGWYLNSLYHLYGVSENVWNISMDPFLPVGETKCDFDLNVYGKKYRISVQQDKGQKVATATTVFTKNNSDDKFNFTPDIQETPYIKSVESIMLYCDYNEQSDELIATLKAFPGHKNEITISALTKPEEIIFEDRNIEAVTIEEKDSFYKIKIDVVHQQNKGNLIVRFNKELK